MTDPIWTTLVAMADCLCQEIENAGLPEPCACSVLPGEQVPYDFCNGCDDGKCGQAWARLVTAFPSAQFPMPDPRARCGAPLAFQVELGIMRCAPQPDDQGNPPTEQENLESVALQTADAAAMRRAIVCCVADRDHVMLAYVPTGPLGGCVGGTWSVIISEL